MSIRIKIESPEVKVKSGVSARTGKPYNIREQEAWAFTADDQGKAHPHPVRILVALRDEQQPYTVGDYTVCPSSFYADRFNVLTLGLRLKPLASTLSQPKAA